MKKFFAAVIAIVLILLSFVGCAGNGGEDEISLPPEDDNNGVDNFSLIYNDVTIHVGDLMEGKTDCALRNLGKPVSSSSTNSCAYQGLDKTYDYSGFTISTYPDGNLDYILNIAFTDDVMKTPAGIHIGSTLDEVKAAYGNQEPKNDLVSYTKGKTILTMKISGNVVTAIQYDLIED